MEIIVIHKEDYIYKFYFFVTYPRQLLLKQQYAASPLSVTESRHLIAPMKYTIYLIRGAQDDKLRSHLGHMETMTDQGLLDAYSKE